MEHRISYTAIGAFVILLGGVLTALLIWLAAGGTRPSFDTYAIYLKTGAETLGPSSQVFYHGVPVGRVLSVSLAPSHPQAAQVLVGIRENLAIRADVEARLESRLTGPSYIQLTGGAPSAPVLVAKAGRKYPVIPASPGDVDVLLESAHKIAGNLITVSKRLKSVLSEKNVRSLSQTLAGVHKITASLARSAGKLDNIVSNLNATLVHARAASSRLPALLADLDRTLANYRMLARKAGAAAHNVSRAANRLGSLTPNARHLLSRLEEVTENLDRLVQELSRHPNSVIFGKPVHPGPGESKPSGG